MPDSLKVRANALRAEAKAARADVTAEYQSRMTKIDTESARVRRDTRNAEQSAKQAAEDAEDYAAGARVQYTSANELEESAATAAQRGDVKQAEEDNELAAHARGAAQRYEQQERDATLEAAKYREDAAGHDLRAKELQYEVRDTNRLNNAAEQQLDNLEERARLYDEAIRKFEEADGPVNAPTRARLQREADAEIAKADAIEVDRAAIRVLSPDFPEQTPGFDGPVSASESTRDEQAVEVAMEAAVTAPMTVTRTSALEVTTSASTSGPRSLPRRRARTARRPTQRLPSRRSPTPTSRRSSPMSWTSRLRSAASPPSSTSLRNRQCLPSPTRSPRPTSRWARPRAMHRRSRQTTRSPRTASRSGLDRVVRLSRVKWPRWALSRDADDVA